MRLRQRSGSNRSLAERSREREGGAGLVDQHAAEIHPGETATTPLCIRGDGDAVAYEAQTQRLSQELSQEKQRTLELLGVKEQEENDTPARAAGGHQGDEGDADLLKDLQHIEEEMKVLLKEKEQAEEK